ncbi:MAG: SIS domain-containing protein [Armatimonadetes bacterium]|nr:SIS domain-containing protein [Armatimonadota bacterium]
MSEAVVPTPSLTAASYLDRVISEAQKVDLSEVDDLVEAFVEVYTADQFVFVIGNGGSGANASHFCEDLGKSTLVDFEDQKRLRILSLTDNTPCILAWANDTSYEHIFVEQLKNLASPGDWLVAISGSGNSPNILRAVEYANTHSMETFGVTGFDGGKLRQISHRCFHVPCDDMGVCETVHTIFFHYLVDKLRERFAFLHTTEAPGP